MSRYANTITLVLMGVFVYFGFGWVESLRQDLGFQFYLLIGLIGGGAHTIADGLVKAAILTKQKLSGASA